jgi:predicted acylesterase/phospholipase RssA
MPDDDLRRIRRLGLTDPRRYDERAGEPWLRWSPARAARAAATGSAEDYRAYADASCDLTMRGGSTSGVIYPLAACSLAQHYVFRSVGGSSAGAIAAAATAAAEYGRCAPVPEQVADGQVEPGFAGLARLVEWLASGKGAERWRLAQLFQPQAALRRLFRLVVAPMQRPETTGRSPITAVAVALLSAVGSGAGAVLAALLLCWLAGPVLLYLGLPDDPTGPSRPIAAAMSVCALGAAAWSLRIACTALGRAALVVLTPLVPLSVAVAITPSPWGAAGWAAALSAVVLYWLLSTYAVLAAFAAIFTRAVGPLLADAGQFGFGILPGATAYRPNWIDRLCGVPESTGVDPLSTWLADRIDELAGLGVRSDRALTFGDLWLGPGVPRDVDELAARAADSSRRVINLVLMTTDLSAGRPFRLPFLAATATEDGWQFCGSCLHGLVPDRVVRQLSRADTAGLDCPKHPGTPLRWLPEPWDMPVVLAVRMSLSMPGLICAVPLYRKGRPHWFSDGGITSNFPIHLFDVLLPRWPTFGLNLEHRPGDVEPGDGVHLAEQDSSPPTVPWSPLGSGAVGFARRILDTFLGWRDTMQAALPGFRGRIATVRQGAGEGGTNLFMPPEVIATLALRGYRAGEQLKTRFTVPGAGDEPAVTTQTDRYRWIRMRLAMREYRQLTEQVRDAAPLYADSAIHYRIPQALAGWFGDAAGPWPLPEPYSERIALTFDELGRLAEGPLAEPLEGTSPVDPALRLTPPE